ncbi:MAG: hypothetical protein WC314_09245 [Vulcanimicrobiota bacterium]
MPILGLADEQVDPGWNQEVSEARKRLAAVDARFASSWIAGSYKVPERVPQELLYNGYSYAETLIALAFMGEGVSLNEILEQRRLLGGARWKDVASTLNIDTAALPPEISQLLWFGRNSSPAPVIHFLPDPYPGITRDLLIPAFEPTVPSDVLVNRFRLNNKEIKDIRRVLDDPLGVPEKDLLLPAGRGLVTADWVLAGTVAYFKPFPMESMLAARLGEDIPWSEVSLAFGFRPDVLTQGAMSGIYPVLAGYAPHTALIARKRETHPTSLPLNFDLERLTPGEKRALRPLLYHHYQATAEEKAVLADKKFEMGEEGLALVLARMSTLDLSIILSDYEKLRSWNAIVKKYAIDLTGHGELKAVMDERDKLL